MFKKRAHPTKVAVPLLNVAVPLLNVAVPLLNVAVLYERSGSYW